MSADAHVIGFKPPDEKWQKMKQVYEACRLARIDPPDEVLKFFNYEPPGDHGVRVDLAAPYTLKQSFDCITRIDKNGYDGYDVDLSKLPDDIKILRFLISY